LEKFETGKYIISIEPSFTDYKKEFYIDTSKKSLPYIYEVNNLEGYFNIK
jgi:hypothetical protein